MAEGEYFHVFNRGVEKRPIFFNDSDRWRFLTLLMVLQGDTVLYHIERLVSDVQHRRLDKSVFEKIIQKRYVELVCFCLMDNHFHLILRATKKDGISKYMQRLGDAYTKYINIKYDRTGHLFGGKFQSRHIDENSYFNHLSAYIHLNPGELRGWRHKEIKYPWSSFQDFILENRWNDFLVTNMIADQFTKKEYRDFVQETPIRKLLEFEDIVSVQHWVSDNEGKK